MVTRNGAARELVLVDATLEALVLSADLEGAECWRVVVVLGGGEVTLRIAVPLE